MAENDDIKLKVIDGNSHFAAIVWQLVVDSQ